jgi:hypothetical protein
MQMTSHGLPRARRALPSSPFPSHTIKTTIQRFNGISDGTKEKTIGGLTLMFPDDYLMCG